MQKLRYWQKDSNGVKALAGSKLRKCFCFRMYLIIKYTNGPRTAVRSSTCLPQVIRDRNHRKARSLVQTALPLIVEGTLFYVSMETEEFHEWKHLLTSPNL